MIHRASSLGGCLKGQIAAALGQKPIPVDEASQLRMNEGAIHEDDVIARLTGDGSTVTRQQEGMGLIHRDAGWEPVVALPYDRSHEFPPDHPTTIWGKVDGAVNGDLLDRPQNNRVLEVKSMSDSVYKDFQSKGWHADWPAGSLIDKYRWQLSVYMLATGLEGLLVTKNRNSGQMTQHGIETPYYTLEQITERVAYIEDHVARGQLPDECPHDWFCPYKYLCTKPNEEVAELGSDSDELSPVALLAVEQYDFLGGQIKVLEEQRAGHRAVFEAELGDRVKVQAGGYRIQRVTQQIKEKVVPASTRTMLRVTKLEEEASD